MVRSSFSGQFQTHCNVFFCFKCLQISSFLSKTAVLPIRPLKATSRMKRYPRSLGRDGAAAVEPTLCYRYGGHWRWVAHAITSCRNLPKRAASQAGVSTCPTTRPTCARETALGSPLGHLKRTTCNLRKNWHFSEAN